MRRLLWSVVVILDEATAYTNRTYNMKSPYPEEFNRQAIGLTASLHFAPTQKAADALLKEGKDPEQIFVTGNTGIDALHYTVRNDFYHPEIEWAKDSRLIAVTAHRRENLGELCVICFGLYVGLWRNSGRSACVGKTSTGHAGYNRTSGRGGSRNLKACRHEDG